MKTARITSTKLESLTARWVDTPIGRMLLAAEPRAIVMLEFSDDDSSERRLHAIAQRVEFNDCHPLLEQAAQQLDEYFEGTRRDFALSLSPLGTDFERRAWDYLRAIPFGQTRSYGQQARAIAGPNACRAVGRANGSNPIAVVIPCHRVIGADGSLTGFASGIHRKRWLLDHEARFCASAPSPLFMA